MRLDRFDLNLLVVLDVLLEERNVTKASQRLHIGQSAASSALARLREYFGDELLMPVGRRLALTPLAQSLVEPVRDTLLRARATLSLKPGFDPASAERRFSVCASDYVTLVVLARAARRIAEQAPGVALDIRTPPKDVIEVFERGSIDLLVMPAQYVTRLGHPQAPLFEDSQVCIVWSGNTEVGDRMTFEDYVRLGHVTLRLGDALSMTFEEWFLPADGKRRRVDTSVDNFALLPMLVIGTQRVATVHRRLAEHFAKEMPLRLIEVPFETPQVVEVMTWPRYLDQDPAHAWLRDTLRSCAAGL